MFKHKSINQSWQIKYIKSYFNSGSQLKLPIHKNKIQYVYIFIMWMKELNSGI